MKNKYITDGLVTQRMSERGWIEGCDQEHAMNQVMAEFECQIVDNWLNPDFSVYEESTADGYSVWVASANTSNININEDIYYYENDLSDVLYEAIPEYNMIFCESLDTFVEEAITRHYEDLLILKEEEILDELVNEGYVTRVFNPLNTLQYIEMISQDDQFNKDKPELYMGAINIDSNLDYKWLDYASQIIKDRSRYEIVANHYGLTISKAVYGEIIFKELKDGV